MILRTVRTWLSAILLFSACSQTTFGGSSFSGYVKSATGSTGQQSQGPDSPDMAAGRVMQNPLGTNVLTNALSLGPVNGGISASGGESMPVPIIFVPTIKPARPEESFETVAPLVIPPALPPSAGVR